MQMTNQPSSMCAYATACAALLSAVQPSALLERCTDPALQQTGTSYAVQLRIWQPSLPCPSQSHTFTTHTQTVQHSPDVALLLPLCHRLLGADLQEESKEEQALGYGLKRLAGVKPAGAPAGCHPGLACRNGSRLGPVKTAGTAIHPAACSAHQSNSGGKLRLASSCAASWTSSKGAGELEQHRRARARACILGR